MISWDNIAIGLRESHKMTPQQRQAQFGNQRHVALTAAGGSNTIPMRQHPELGQAHFARLNYQSVQWAQAKQEVPARKHGDQCFFSTERDQKSCDLSGGCGTTDSLSNTSHVISGTTHQSCFQHLLLRCQFLTFFFEEVVLTTDGSRPKIWCAAESASLSCHTCSVSSSISQILMAQLHSQHFPPHLHCYWALVWLFKVSLQNRNDHVWSFCRYTRSHTWWAQLDEQSKNGSVGRISKTFMERKLVTDRIHQSLLGEVHETS